MVWRVLIGGGDAREDKKEDIISDQLVIERV
ncbi:hypothetical protein FOXYSP1_01260 [Fusarium oxysporum f. sp. phaseoli]|jgi:hypothetical protein